MPAIRAIALCLSLSALLMASRCEAQSRVEWDEAAAQRIEAELATPFEGDFYEIPVGDVAAYIRDFYGLTVVVNDADSLYSGTLINYVPAPPETLGAALTRMLEPIGMDWTIDGGALYIAGSDVINVRQYVRIYDVSHLVEDEDYDEQSLCEFITEFVDPEDWEVDGYGYGSIRSFDGLLVVLQDYHTHRRLETFIEQIQSVHEDSAQQPEVADDGDPNGPQSFSESEPTAVAYRVYAPASLVADVVDGAAQTASSYGYGLGYGYDLSGSVDATADTTASGESTQRGESFSSELVEIVLTVVAPEAWGEESECTIEALPGYVIVRAPDDVQAQVREFLQPFMEQDSPKSFGDPTPGYSDYSTMGGGFY